MVKKHYHAALLVVVLMLAGCGDSNDTSSGGDSADVSENDDGVATDSGGVILAVSEDKALTNDVINLRYTVRNAAGEDQAGTLFWDDNSSSRVSGNGTLNHIYRAPGTYRIAIEPDGEERMIVATIEVSALICPPLVIPAFNTTTGIPASVSSEFAIRKIDGCFSFTVAEGFGSSSISVFSAGGDDGRITFFTGGGLFSLECVFDVRIGANNCRIPTILGGFDGTGGIGTFASEDDSICTGRVQLTGDESTLVVSSSEIRITCR